MDLPNLQQMRILILILGIKARARNPLFLALQLESEIQFKEWKIPQAIVIYGIQIPLTNITESRIPGVESRQDCFGYPYNGRNRDFCNKSPVLFPPRGSLPFTSDRGMCRPKGYGFCAFLVRKRVWFSREPRETYERIHCFNSK